jgi:hypothetical protein
VRTNDRKTWPHDRTAALARARLFHPFDFKWKKRVVMKAITPFFFETKEIRAFERDGEPWFVATDICKILDISNVPDALRRLDPDEKGIANVDTLGGVQDLNIINESGLYILVLGCRKPGARRPISNPFLGKKRAGGNLAASSLPLGGRGAPRAVMPIESH